MNGTLVCASGVDLLADYLEDALPADVRARLDAHVTGCPRCTAFVASYRETPRILRQATLAALPEDLAASLISSLRRGRS
jgi:anti-sigma factor RsiW